MRTNPFTKHQQEMISKCPENPLSAILNKLDLTFFHLLTFKSILLLILGVVWGTIALAQKPTAVVKITSVAPVIDGIVDDIWATANEYNIALPYRLETPTLGTLGQTTWKALWDHEGIYILVKVADNVFSPAYDKGEGWLYDKPELSFDCNYEKKDGLGTSYPNSGHYCFAPAPVKGQIRGGQFFDTFPNEIHFSYYVTDPSYLVEYFIPFTKLLDKDGNKVDVTQPIGFDISISDNDTNPPTRNRMGWSNAGAIDENWNNMDDAGEMVLEPTSYDPPDIITLTPDSITKDKGTLQLIAHLTPESSTNVKLIWTVTNVTGKASINDMGLVTALSNGTVTVKVTVLEQPWLEATATVTISGQIADENEVWNYFNLIKNWNFNTDLTNWGFWVDGSAGGQTSPVVLNGVVSMTTALAADGATWHYQFNQSELKAEANVPYILKFKSWSSKPRSNELVFEDSPQNNYNRYGASSDPEAVNGKSDWVYSTTIEPRWFTFHVIFDKMIPTTQQKIQWMLSTANATT
ncbi:MAG TPA: hypothetical protein DCL77_02180 [Prolixibacteraceae bacterium]|jgi:hypothetical protein|nr:hypothetical protein [Prolixibacteraceae bacterium]